MRCAACHACWWHALIQAFFPFFPRYHAQTLGFLIGELIKRVTAASAASGVGNAYTIGEFFKEFVADRFEIDCHIGLPEGEEYVCERVG